IFDNENLQELFPFDQMDPRSKLVIESGRIFFHLNPKLCLKHIDELNNHTIMREYSGGKKWSDYDVSPHSNGEKVPCEVSKLHVEVFERSRTAEVKFDNFMRNMTDRRTLLGYLIFYKEAPARNVTMYDGRDACGSSEWDSIDYAIDTTTEDQEPYESTIVTQLQPFTQYALFIRTYTMIGQKKGAISDIIYFTTMPSQPMPPVNVISSAKGTNEIEITWNPPKKPNGNLTHYIVRVYGEPDLNLDRNYCEEPLTYSKPNWTIPEPIHHESLFTSETRFLDGKTCCSCKKSKGENLDRIEREQREIKELQDHIINKIYVKNDNDIDEDDDEGTTNKRKRSVPTTTVQQSLSSSTAKDYSDDTVTVINSTSVSNGTSKDTNDNRVHYFEYIVDKPN
ncbi:Insulin-like peptide receptor, partial [Leptotrombidium deliense]